MKKGLIVASSIVLLAVVAIVLLLLWPSPAIQPAADNEVQDAFALLSATAGSERYSYADFLSDHPADIIDAVAAADPQGGAELPGGGEVTYRIDAPSRGLYWLSLETQYTDTNYMPLTLAMTVNGLSPYREARNIEIPVYWEDSTKDFPIDSFGDEVIPEQVNIAGWHRVNLYNSTYISDTPLLVLLEQGSNNITFANNTGRSLGVGVLTASGYNPAPAYADYLTRHSGGDYGSLLSVNSIDYTAKNSSYMSYNSSIDASLTPTDAVDKKINILFWTDAGNTADFSVDIPEDGFYCFAFHGLNYNDDLSNFASLLVNGEAPFAEALSFELRSTAATGYKNFVFSNNEGEPYRIWFPKGTHTISLRADLRPLMNTLNDLQLLIDHINKFSLDVKKFTGREIDKNRTWYLTRYIPETAAYLDAYDVVIRHMLFNLEAYSEKGIKAAELSGLNEALALLDIIREKPDELPLYLTKLSGGQASVLSGITKTVENLYSQGFDVDMLYFYGKDVTLPKPKASFLKTTGTALNQLWASFVSPKYQARNEPDAINIWVNRSSLHVDALQKLIDTQYTPRTGQKIHVSIMPDVNKLVLATAAGTTPDIALAVQTHISFDLSSRGALYPLSSFDDFWEVASRSTPGAYTGSIFDDQVYALPEVLDFAALVYRQDVFEQLNLTVPDTWDDVSAMMSELQRYSMSFYMPIAIMEGYKWFQQTTPLIYQAGGSLYHEDGLGSAINEPAAVKGLTLLGELFTTYALPKQIPSFFSAFRFSETPIGILDLNNYLLFSAGAPELSGQWALAPNPGTVQEDGSVSRWFVTNCQGGVVFEDTEKPQECWDFLKWWTSTETQEQYAFTMQSAYGIYWLSANLQAIQNAPIPDEDLSVVLEMIPWLRDTPRSPGQYLLERSLSDIWNAMVFDNAPPQVAIDLRIIDVQREFRRKMMEFGYADQNGNLTREYHVRELDWVVEQMQGKGGAS